jgi:hypothetical protein
MNSLNCSILFQFTQFKLSVNKLYRQQNIKLVKLVLIFAGLPVNWSSVEMFLLVGMCVLLNLILDIFTLECRIWMGSST